MVSQWFSAANASKISPDQLLEGSPLDRNLLLGFIALGIIVLIRRKARVAVVCKENFPILAFFLYCGVSTLWSDYTDVSLKRWIKAAGDLIMMLVVLTDLDRLSAIKRLLSRVSFVVIPASILLIKYYPNLGMGYNDFTGQSACNGVTLNKNQLGYVCLLFGLASVWRILGGLHRERGRLITGPLVAHSIILMMVIWLFWKADSMTSFACFLMATSLVVAGYLGALGRRAWRTHLMVSAMLSVAVSALFLHVGTGLVQTMGRDPTLTGRNDIWKLVLGMAPNSVLGAGFESFWLGPRLQAIWDVYWWHPVQSHDGYIDVFLNLGLVGICVLGITLFAAYRSVVADIRKDPRQNCVRLGYLVAAIAYNFTESAFVMLHPVWIFLLLAGVKVPGGWAPIFSRRNISRLITTEKVLSQARAFGRLVTAKGAISSLRIDTPQLAGTAESRSLRYPTWKAPPDIDGGSTRKWKRQLF